MVKRRRKPAILPPRGSHRNNPRNAGAASRRVAGAVADRENAQSFTRDGVSSDSESEFHGISSTGANGSQAQAGQPSATQPGATEAAPPTPPRRRPVGAPTVARHRRGEEAPPSRSRMRSETNEDTNDRAAKASNTGNGLSPAASAAHFATRGSRHRSRKVHLAGNSSQAAEVYGTNPRGGRETKRR